MNSYTSLGYKKSDLEFLLSKFEAEYDICYEVYDFGSFDSGLIVYFVEIEGLSDLCFHTLLNIELNFAESLSYVKILDSWFNQFELKKALN